jgi:hypothetical protein
MGVYTYFGGCLSEIFDHNAMFDPISARTVPQQMLRLAKASDDLCLVSTAKAISKCS